MKCTANPTAERDDPAIMLAGNASWKSAARINTPERRRAAWTRLNVRRRIRNTNPVLGKALSKSRNCEKEKEGN